MCQQGGELLWEVIEQGGDLFDFWKTCCAQGFESASFWESCTCEREKLCFGSVCFVSGSWVFLVFPPLPAWLRRVLPLSLRSHVLVGFWSIASSRCPCLRESICAWVSDYSWLSELVVTCLSSSLSGFYFITSLVSGGVLTTVRWWVNCQPCGVIVRLVFGL